MKILKLIYFLYILVGTPIIILAQTEQRAYVIPSAGGTGSSGQYKNIGTFGQPIAGKALETPFKGYFGFLSGEWGIVIPILSTKEITNIALFSANSGGEITNDGGAVVIVRGVCWNTTGNPTIIDNHTNDGSGVGSFSSAINGLANSTTYHLRAYATNLSGTGYGEEFIFTTHHPPVAICQDVTVDAGEDCSADASINNGSYDPDGDINTLAQEPKGPYPVGETLVTLTVTDALGATNSCTAIVTVKHNTATIYVYGALHTTGAGKTPTAKKTALAFDLRIFDRTGMEYNPKDFPTIWSENTQLSASLFSITGPDEATYGGGPVEKYTITLPASCSDIGNNGYLVIGKATIDGSDFYVGNSTNSLTNGSSTNIYLQVIKNANGKKVPATTTPVTGSLLLLAEPAYIEFTSSEELFPVICESVDGEWDININLDPPEGFVSTPGSLSTDVTTSDMNAVQFTVKDIGSKWTHTKVTHKIKHKGKNSEVVTNPAMIDKQPKKKDAEFNGTEDISGYSVEEEIAVRLKQNYPNPFAGLTELQYFVSKKEHATLVLTDISGRVVANLVDRYVNGGWNTLIVNGSGLTAGVYILRLESMGKSALMKIVKAD